ncbi:SMC family ATPase [Candidatus Woesearchaeota archaeon]|nr:SMC family ATPase [Candidatus Woesearchaeota archaeon]
MLLKSIKLRNIRSYLEQKIDFSIGTLLLSGDIGSGKSTVLLATEFALFGSNPSELPASSLLRHGKNEGSVELNFELDGKNIVIKRNLKKGKHAIKQETGYIIINDVKKELSPVEMKSEVFDLLGYPKDLVAKGKDLIYRYTVYTPQEEMKRILAEDKDARLNTLRKVFNIDKYKKIRENASIFIRGLKEKKKEFEGFISDLAEKKKELSSVNMEISELNKKLKNILPKLKDAKKEAAEKKGSISVFEKKISELNKLKNSLAVCEADLNNLLRDHNKNNESIARLKNQVKNIETGLEREETKKTDDIKGKISNVKKNFKNLQQEIDVAKQKLSESRIGREKSGEIISKVSEMEKCPLCLQKVGQGHKDSIKERESRNIAEAERNIGIYSAKEKEIKAGLDELEKEMEMLKKAESMAEILRIKISNLKEKREEKKKLEGFQEEIKKNIGNLNAKKIELAKTIGQMKSLEEDYQKARKEYDVLLSEERRLEIEKTGFEKEEKSLMRIAGALKEEIEKKSMAREKLNYFSELQNWVENYFLNLMGTMEKHVMMQVYREFNDLFKTWFNILIEDDAISVSLDDEFSPVVEQNGYETSVDSLSGGEKTSVALSYRLALNKVINDIVSGIKTKDILMLDEPTDGFSSEQLDKVRDVLDQLKIRQVVIVSHETKIESFVDNVIRIEKEGHASRAC